MSFDYSHTLPKPLKVSPVDVALAKRELRDQASRQRTQLMSGFPNADVAGVMLRNCFLDRCPLPPKVTVAGYWPREAEIDVRPLMVALADRGISMALPVVINRHQSMRFRKWTTGAPLITGRFGIPVPPDTIPEVVPNVVLVPLLSFDRQGYRLGHGSGLYDRTLQTLRAYNRIVAIGIAFAGQEVPAVPHDAFDQRLDWIVTERYAVQTTSSMMPNPLAAFGQLR